MQSLKVLITLVGCRLTPANSARSLKAAAPGELPIERGENFCLLLMPLENVCIYYR